MKHPYLVIPYLMALNVSCSNMALADPISPKMHGRNHTYSKERASSHFYGNGIAGRKTEASVLRMTGEGDIDAGEFEEAVRKLGKAVKLDPGDPGGHVLYAKALTGLFYSKPDVDEKMLGTLIKEWTLIARHSADQDHQYTARGYLKQLKKIRKALIRKQEKLEEQQLAESGRKKSLGRKLFGRFLPGKAAEPEALAESADSKSQ